MNPKSKMDKLSPVPVPASQKWKNFRVQVLPSVVWLGCAFSLLFLWTKHVAPPAMVGQVEFRAIEVSSPSAGALAQLSVQRFQKVKRGEIIARIVTVDPKVIQANLAVISAEVGFLKSRLAADIHQNQLDYQRLKLDLMEQKVRLATSRVDLQLANSEYTRAQRLHDGLLISDQELDIAVSKRDALKAEVQENELLVEQTEAALTVLAPTVESATSPESNPLLAAIEVQSQKLRLAEVEMSPVDLIAPMDGMISAVHRQSGENVAAGDAILVISSEEATGIVGYIPATFPTRLEAGMNVIVRSRNASRPEANSEILAVGVQVESIPNRLRLDVTQEETGIPVYVRMPANLDVFPGEKVDVIVKI